MGAAIANVVLLLGAGAVLSAWAQYARSNRFLAVALYVAFSALAVLLGLAGLVALAGRSSTALSQLNLSATVGYVLIAAALCLVLPLLPPVRYLLSLVTPMDPHSITDAAGLAAILAFVVTNLGASIGTSASALSSVSIASIVLQDATFVVLAFLAVGTFMTRDVRCAVSRLGLVLPTRRQVLIALGLVVVAFGISIIAALLLHFFEPSVETQIASRMKNLTGPFQSVGGAVILGLSAGIGEEILFRGAIQPRYGVVLTSLLFALLHFQYALSFDTLAVFLVGIVLGIERNRLNTTSSIITHVVYDTLAVLAGTG